MAASATQNNHVLYVTGPVRERLYRRFRALFDGREDVEVRLDRRQDERRRKQLGPRSGERRRRERRHRDPDWIVPPDEV